MVLKERSEAMVRKEQGKSGQNPISKGRRKEKVV
jgi:hypothetical protein